MVRSDSDATARELFAVARRPDPPKPANDARGLRRDLIRPRSQTRADET